MEDRGGALELESGPQWYGERPRRGPAAAASNYPRPIAEQTDTAAEVEPSRAEEMVGEGAQLIDVRQDYEWEAGHIAGAVHVPLERLPAHAEQLDRERAIVFQCRSGSRSALAAAAFRESGFDAYNLSGGLLAWVEADKPIEPAGGEVAGPKLDAT